MDMDQQPARVSDDTENCIMDVYKDWHHYQCGRKCGHGLAQLYCKQCVK